MESKVRVGREGLRRRVGQDVYLHPRSSGKRQCIWGLVMAVCMPWHSHSTPVQQDRAPLKGIPESSALELCTGALCRFGRQGCKESCPCADGGGVLGCGCQDLWGHSTNDGNQGKRGQKQKKTGKEIHEARSRGRGTQRKANKRNHLTHILGLPEPFKIILNIEIS